LIICRILIVSSILIIVLVVILIISSVLIVVYVIIIIILIIIVYRFLLIPRLIKFIAEIILVIDRILILLDSNVSEVLMISFRFFLQCCSMGFKTFVLKVFTIGIVILPCGSSYFGFQEALFFLETGLSETHIFHFATFFSIFDLFDVELTCSVFVWLPVYFGSHATVCLHTTKVRGHYYDWHLD